MEMFMESLKLAAILFGLIVMNIVSGTVVNVLMENKSFDWQVMITGIVKALVACISLIALAYVFGVVDLSSLGFEPRTAISSGILVYAAKVLANVSKLIGINTGLNKSDSKSSIEEKVEDMISDLDVTSTEDTNPEKEESSDIAVG